tara:strand:- start:5132 stop:7375 length:2244 start_codon:yes stop_codon:yes gene_type:complete
MAGRILNGKYRVLSELGAGSMGTVYLGEHVALKKKIALKILHRELQIGDEPLQRFQREGIAAGQITHTNVIQIFDFDRTEDGTSYLAMEYVEGENLKDLLAREGALPTNVALSITRQLLSTLVEAHKHGVVHRDIKPENLMIVRGPGEKVTLKVLDFGLSKLVDRPLDASLQTMSGRVMGTPLYMAPEQWHGEDVDQRSDLYSVALILYEMLTGHQPFKGGNVTETLMRSTTEAPPSVLDHVSKHPVPVDLDSVLRQGMAKQRDERFQDASDMLEALDEVRLDRVQNASGQERSSGARKRPARSPRQRETDRAAGGSKKQLLAIAGGVVVVLVAWLIWNGSGNAHGDAPLISGIPAEQRSEQQKEYVSLLTEARDRLRTGDIASAMAVADKAARRPIADAESFFVRGEVYRRQKDFDTARLDYQEAIKRLPGYAHALAGLGWLEVEKGDLNAAAEQFTIAIDADVRCGFALAGRAAVLMARNTPEQALEVLADTTIEDPLVYLYRGEAQLAVDDVDLAVQSFVQAKRGDPSFWRTYRGLALAYEQQDDHEAAEQQCIAGLTMASDARELRVLHAQLLLAQDRFADALTALAAAAPKDGDLLAVEGVAEQGLGNGEAAIAAWTKALEMGVKDVATVNLLLAMQYARDADWVKARRFARQAIAADGELAKAHFYAGLAAFRIEDYSGAVGYLQRAVDLDGEDLVARYTLGVIFMDYQQRPQDAITQFEAYVDAGGSDEKVEGWLRTLKG